MDYSAWYPLMLPKQNPQIWNSLWTYLGSEGRDYERVPNAYHSKLSTAQNHTNLKLDEMIEKVPQTIDPVERKRLALESVVTAKNQYTAIQVVGVQNILALSARVGSIAGERQTRLSAKQFETMTHAK